MLVGIDAGRVRPRTATLLTATYAGDVQFGSSTGTALHDVNPVLAETTTVIDSDTPDPSTVNQAVHGRRPGVGQHGHGHAHRHGAGA